MDLKLVFMDDRLCVSLVFRMICMVFLPSVSVPLLLHEAHM